MPYQKGIRTRPETKVFPHVAVCNIIQKRLISDYRHTHSWDAVGLLYGITRGLAFMVAMRGYEPNNSVLREKLGYPILTEVELIASTMVPDHTQILEIRECRSCHRPFVPNVPSRMKCYLCAPSRRKV